MATLYATQDRETGTVIDVFTSQAKAERAIARYEAEDKKNGIYTKNFYEVTIHDHE